MSILDINEKRVADYIQAKRPPVELREQVDLGYSFKNNEVIPAKIIATEKVADVALIKLIWPPSDKKIHIAKVADSDKVKTGEQVFVIGSPYGLTQSLSVGHISGRHSKKSVSYVADSSLGKRIFIESGC